MGEVCKGSPQVGPICPKKEGGSYKRRFLVLRLGKFRICREEKKAGDGRGAIEPE